MKAMMNKEELETELMAMGMDREYTVHMKDDQTDWGHTFSSKDIMKLCTDMCITRRVTVLAPQSKHFGQDLLVIKSEYWGGWYQVRLPGPNQRRYTFPNLKIRVSDETLEQFKVACRTWEKPTDYINREFKVDDIIFLRQFYRVKKVFGGFMMTRPLDGSLKNGYQKVLSNEASRYLIIDDPIVHLAL